MTRPHAIEALAEQHDRLGELLRKMDDGRWWSEDEACRTGEDEVGLQADRIGSALDVIERLAGEMAAENGTGAGSQLASKAKYAAPVPNHPPSESRAVPEDLRPFSPGQVGPLHDEIHETGGYEQRAWGVSGGTSKMA